MIIKASGRSALILATGLFVCFAGPSQAATGARRFDRQFEIGKCGGEHRLHSTKISDTARITGNSYAHRKFHKVALKPAEDTKAAATDVAADSSAAPSNLPPSVANANAQLPSPAAPGDDTMAMTARANDLLAGRARQSGRRQDRQQADDETLVVAADQLNDVDRALHEGNRAGGDLGKSAGRARDGQ